MPSKVSTHGRDSLSLAVEIGISTQQVRITSKRATNNLHVFARCNSISCIHDGPLCVGLRDVGSCAHCPSHSKLSLLAAFHGDGLERSTPRRFHCCHIREQMPDNVCKHMSFTFLQVYFLVEHSFNTLSI